MDFEVLAKIVGVVLAIGVGIVLIRYLLVPICKGLVWLVKHIFKFVISEISDVFRIVGAIITSIFFAFLCVGNIVIGRWSASAHYGRGVTGEFKTMGSALYRIAIGNPARLFCLTSLTEGIENRLPQMMAESPTSDVPTKRTGQFDGYKIVGSIAAGGSGGKLFVAEPDEVKLAAFARNGIGDARQVVIKSFSLKDGSSLPQIVRESRSLDAAKKMGLILDHELTADRFYYVMRYVPGQSLSQVTKQLHAQSGSGGLSGSQLRAGMTYIADLVATLEDYHRGGLWHKDVKPDNIIVDGSRAHLVDFGLITPLRSAMTLTTHGTEYFRDPEMVRQALKGVKVHEVDGTKFDIYGAGAVMFSVLEDSFPAHGVLSAFGKNSPEALRWIVRRAMSDYDKRYATAGEMLADLRYVMTAGDAASVKPFELPSMRGAAMADVAPTPTPERESFRQTSPGVFTVGGFGANTGGQPGAQAEPHGAPKIRVVNWWTGKSELKSDAAQGVAQPQQPWPDAMRGMGAKVASDALGAAVAGIAAAQQAVEQARAKRHGAGTPRVAGTAAEQLERARIRVQQAQERARARFSRVRGGAGPKRYRNGVTSGVFTALGLVGVTFFIVQGVARQSRREDESRARTQAREIERSMLDELVVLPSGSLPDFDVPAVSAPTVPSIVGSAVTVSSTSPTARLEKPSRKGSPSAAKPLKQYVGRKLLIVNELLPPLDSEMEGTLDHATEAMTLLGFDLGGNVPGRKVSDLPKEQVEREDAMIVEARRLQGTNPIDSKETRLSIEKWLASDEGRPDLLVWVTALGDQDRKKPRLFVFSAEGSQDGRDMAAALKDAIVRNGVR